MTIRTVTSNGVATIEIARPEKKNALTQAMYTAMSEAIAAADADAAVRAVLITGQPGVFTSGNDLEDFMQRPPQASEDSPVFQFMQALVGCGKPVVAAVTGAAIGIGTTMLLHCDLVYAAPDASFKVPFLDLGVVPEAASSVLLPRRIGRARAGAAFFLGEALDAQAALAGGIVTKVVDDAQLDAAAEAAARTIAAKPREAARAMKRLMNHDRDEISAAIRREGAIFGERLASAETRAIMSAFFERAGTRA